MADVYERLDNVFDLRCIGPEMVHQELQDDTDTPLTERYSNQATRSKRCV